MKKNLYLGIFLVIIGIFMLLSNYLKIDSRNYFLLIMGIVFIIAYLFRKNYGFLIPGCILLGIALGTIFGAETIGIGVGFAAIYVIHKLYARISHWWPLIPAVIFLGISLQEQELIGQISAAVFWGIVLIIVGLLILIKKNKDVNDQ